MIEVYKTATASTKSEAISMAGWMLIEHEHLSKLIDYQKQISFGQELESCQKSLLAMLAPQGNTWWQVQRALRSRRAW